MSASSSSSRTTAYTYVVVDEPQGFASSVPPVVAVTAPLGMVRFHGRNPETWEKKGISTAEKFRYLYQPSELKAWVPNLRIWRRSAKEVHAIFNNCYSDYAVRNAEDLAHLLRLSAERFPRPASCMGSAAAQLCRPTNRLPVRTVALPGINRAPRPAPIAETRCPPPQPSYAPPGYAAGQQPGPGQG